MYKVKCSKCGTVATSSNTDLCATCGDPLVTTSIVDKTVASSSNTELGSDQPIFFPVSALKFVLMSLCTFGLYEIFWAFMSWQYVAKSRKQKIVPAARAWFSIIFNYQLLKEMSAHVKSQNGPFNASFSPMGAFVPWLLVSICSRLPGPLGLIGLLSFIPLLPAINYVNELNRMNGKESLINSKFSTINKVAIAIGAILVLLTIFGSFLPDSH